MKALFLMTFLFSLSSYAQDVFVIKKSMNPKNILHFKANVENCKLKSPSVSSYWIMGEDNGEVEALSSKEKSYFHPIISYSNDSEPDFSIGAMEKMGSKIPDQSIRIRLENCKPKAFLEISGHEVVINEIFVDVNMFMSVNYMTISGIAPNGQKISKRIAN